MKGVGQTILGVLLGVVACAARRGPSPQSSPSADPSAPHDGGAMAAMADASDASVTPPPDARSAWARSDAAIQAAYDALRAQGVTAETLAVFRSAMQADAPPLQPTAVTSLTGALSDDGTELVVQLVGRSLTTYIADATTGKMRGRWQGGDLVQHASGGQSLPRFLSGTHLVPIRERASGELSGSVLAIRNTVDDSAALRTPIANGCAPALTGGRIAYGVREAGTVRVHVWDARTRTEIDDFQPPGDPKWQGCLRLLTSAIVGVAWDGYDVPRGFLLRDVVRRKSLAQVAGGAYGPTTAVTRDDRYVAVGTTPDQRTERNPPPGKTVLIDAKTGAVVASSDECSSPGSFAFDARGQILAAGDLTDICVFAIPSLKLLRRTAALRPPFTKGPWKITQMIAQLRFFGDGALLARTQDGLFAAYRMPSGALVWKGEGGGWTGIEGAGAASIAHAFGVTDFGELVIQNRHIRATADLRVTEETVARADAGKLVLEAWRIATPEPLRGALERVAMQSCYGRGELYPRELCAPP